MRDDIILLGPMCSGKSSVALYLAERLAVLNYPIDRIKWFYRFKNGYDLSKGTRILRTDGFTALLEYSENFFSLREMGLVLDEFRGGVIDFGASHSYYPEDSDLAEATALLSPFRNVILLQPSPDPAECIDVLSQRIRARYSEGQRPRATIESYVAANEQFVRHKSNRVLSKYVVFTNGKSIEQVGEEVLTTTRYLLRR